MSYFNDGNQNNNPPNNDRGNIPPSYSPPQSPYQQQSPSQNPSAGGGYSTYPGPYQTPPQPQPQKKIKTPRQRKPMAAGARTILTVVLSVVLAFAGGLGGAYVSVNYFNPTDPAPVMYQTVIRRSSDGNADGKLTTQQVVEQVANSVVEIRTESIKTGNSLNQYVTTGAGSGVILSEDGYIVTNHHVIEGANKIEVILRDETSYTAILLGSDRNIDIAVLKIEATGLTPAVMGDSSQLKVGEPAIVIGNPLGSLGGSVTTGVISALDRQVSVSNVKMTLLQTNAAVNPGNSGGGLFNEYAELIGIIVAKATEGEGLGFAIPINIAKPVIESIIANAA